MDIKNAWVIRSLQGMDLWWRPDSNGYTSELIAAGIYSRDDAVRKASNRSSDKAMSLESAVDSVTVVRNTVADLLMKEKS